MNVLMVGVDVSKDALEVSLCLPQGDAIPLQSYANDPAHFAALAQAAEE